MNETIFRVLAVLIPVTAMSISGYYRRRADREGGGRVPTSQESRPIFFALRIGGLLLWLSPILYAINPDLLAWSRLGLQEWTRWLGLVLALACIPGIFSLFRHIGTGITPTVTTRREHHLVTTGPYRWIRHPLYTVATTFFLGLALMIDSWLTGALALGAILLLARRTDSEEQNLIAKFGDEYRTYMSRTGRFLPKVF